MPPGVYNATALVSLKNNAVLSTIKYTYKGPDRTPGSATQSVKRGVLFNQSCDEFLD